MNFPDIVARVSMWLADGGQVRTMLDRIRGTSAVSVYLFAAYGVVAIVGVVSIRILTGLAAPAVFGEATLSLMSWQLGVTIVSQPFTNTLIRYHSGEVDAGRGDGFVRAILFWTCTVSGGISVLAALSWVVMRRLHLTNLGLPGVCGMALLVLSTSIRNVSFGRFQAERRNYLYGGLLAAEAFMAAGGAAIGLWLSPTVDGYVLGQGAGALCVAMMGLLANPLATARTLFRSHAAPGVLKKVRSYGLPFAPLGILNWLNNSADRYALGILAGPAAVGLYVASFAIASRSMMLLGSALADVFRPMLFEAANRGDQRATRKIFWDWMTLRALAVVAVIIGIALFGGFINRLILAPAYRASAMPIMMWVAFGYGVQGMIQTIETRMMSLDRTRWLIAPLAVGCVASVAFSFLLIPYFGAVGAGMATTASFLVQGVFTYSRMRKAERLSIATG